MKRRFYHPVLMIVLCLSVALIGCGGSGGGSDGGGNGNSGLSYTGATAPADVDENNASEIAAGALAAGQAGIGMTVSEASSVTQGATDLQVENFRTLNIPRILGSAARSMDLRPQVHQSSLRAEATYTESGIEYGSCGGQVSYTVRINDISGEFEGSFKFSNFCENGVTISGDTDVEGRADPDTGDIITITFWFDNLSDETMRMDGEIYMDFSGSPIICMMDCLLKDKISGKVYWARDYTVYIYEYADRIELEIFGKYYHPAYGCVDVSTEEFFVIYNIDDWPSSGILLMVGANNTKAKLTAIDETTCRIEADTDGDGVFDWDSGPLEWENMEAFDEIEIGDSYMQYRTFSDASQNRYQGWLSFLNAGQPIRESDINSIVLIGPDQNEVNITIGDFWTSDYYFGGWNSGDQQVYYSGPYNDSGFSAYFPDYFPSGPILPAGNYTYEVTTRSGRILTQTHYFPGKLELEIVDNTTMVSEWINGDLKLTWALPDPVGPFDQVRIRLQSGDQIYLILRLANTATEVTIPQQWINNVKQLSNADTMDWYVLLYEYDDTTNNQYARSQSALKAIDDWDPAIPPVPPGEIQNPGFEQGTSGWGTMTTPGTDCAFTIDADAYEGTQAAKLTVNNDGYFALVNTTSIPVNQDGSYKFSLYAKVAGSNIDHITLAIYKSQDPNETPNEGVGFVGPTKFSGNYELFELTVDLEAGDYIRLELGIDNISDTGSVLFDSLDLVNN